MRNQIGQRRQELIYGAGQLGTDSSMLARQAAALSEAHQAAAVLREVEAALEAARTAVIAKFEAREMVEREMNRELDAIDNSPDELRNGSRWSTAQFTD